MRFDADRALATGFASGEGKRSLLLLSMLDRELSRIPAQTTQFLIRRIRYQFWRDALETGNEAGGGESADSSESAGGGHPLAQALRAHFGDRPEALAVLGVLVEAHEQWGEQAAQQEQPSPDDSVQQFARRQGLLFQLGCGLLDSSEAVRLGGDFFQKCGEAYGFCLRLRYLKTDEMLSKELAASQLAKAKSSFEAIKTPLTATSRLIRPALLPLALVSPYFYLFQSADDIGAAEIQLHPAKRVWLLWRAMRRGF